MINSVVIHYNELALKGKNRHYFESLLLANIKKKLGSQVSEIIKESGQLAVLMPPDANQQGLKDALECIPGIAYFSFAARVTLDIESIKAAAFEFAKGKEFSTFKITTRRHDKGFELDTKQLNNIVGEVITTKLKKKAKMESPDLDIKLEIVHKAAYISCEEIQGIGGLPTDQRQKTVALLSGGFDSPVAAYMLMKRGCEVVLVHFQNKSQMTNAVQDKVIKIAQQLSKFQLKTRLYIVPFEELQNEIIKSVRAELRMLIYRRVMIKIASAIADRHKARFLVVGDSLSQVASQTIENLDAVYDAAPKKIFSPLIGMDKEEIMQIARRIGTFGLSALPYGDCCSFFVPKHPELRGDAKTLLETEEKLAIDYPEAAAKAMLHEF